MSDVGRCDVLGVMQGVLQNTRQQRIDLETSPGAHLQAPAGAQLLGGVAEWYYPCACATCMQWCVPDLEYLSMRRACGAAECVERLRLPIDGQGMRCM